ncbi:MAG: hypothetical protein PF541_16155 [Prolixibacteraceae bacterium]|nr:hypothetical protein [Prolixibacteraceae bacterium]
MENIEISQSAKLQLQILQLEAERSSHEDALNQSFKELTHLLFIPASKKKETNSESQDDNKNELLNLSKKVLNGSTDYILEQNFGTKRPFNDFLTSMFIELISAPYINHKIVEIFSGIADQVFEESEENS